MLAEPSSAKMQVPRHLEPILKLIFFAAVLGMLLHNTVAAGPRESLGRLTGDQLVKIWIKQDAVEVTADQRLMREFVSGYLAGAADAAEGISWCDPLTVKAHEIDAEIFWSMKDMQSNLLKRKEAAKFIVEILAKRFPCKKVKK